MQLLILIHIQKGGMCMLMITMYNRFHSDGKVFFAGRLVKQKGGAVVCDFYSDGNGNYYATNVKDYKTFEMMFSGVNAQRKFKKTIMKCQIVAGKIKKCNMSLKEAM